MASDKLIINRRPKFNKPRMLLGFSGWMDGGGTSTGTIECLVDRLDAQSFAEIGAGGFYILNVPGPTEISGLSLDSKESTSCLRKTSKFTTQSPRKTSV